MPALYDAKPIAVRLRQRDRELLQQAAELAGEHPSAFARRAAVERARKVIAQAPGDEA